MNRLSTLLVLLFFMAACAAPASGPASGSPAIPQLGALNAIAVGIAILGGIVGLALSRRKVEPEESERKSKKKDKQRR